MGMMAGDLRRAVPIPVRRVHPETPTDASPHPAPPRFVVELENCIRQVEAGGVDTATVREFQSRRRHDKAVREIFGAIPGFDEKLELAAFVWMKANPSDSILPADIAIALTYLSRYKDKIFFSASAIPCLEILAAGDEAALSEFCAIINSCPDLDLYSVYRDVGRQRKIYVAYEATPIERLLEEFNTQGIMGSFEAFLLDDTDQSKSSKGGVGLIRRERQRQVRAEGRIELAMFRKLQTRLHFEGRPEILELLGRSSTYASSLAGFVSTYIDGYEMETHDLVTRIGAMLVHAR